MPLCAQEARSKMPTSISLGGFVDAQYTLDDARNTFFIRRARLILTGSLLPGLEFKVQPELAGTPRLLDAFFKYSFRPWFNFQAGQFKTPFTLESQYSLLTKEGIDYAQVIAKLAGYGDILGGNRSNARDIGFMISGNLLEVGEGRHFPLLSYNVALVNGPGINRRDDNLSKDIIARFDVRPIVRNLVLSASVVAGTYNDETVPDATNNRFSFGGEYKTDALTLRSEYVRADIGRSGEMTVSDGYYFVAGYWFDLPTGQRIRPVLRYDTYNDGLFEAGSANATTTLCMASLDYWPVSHLRLQAAYTRDISSGRNILQAMASVKF